MHRLILLFTLTLGSFVLSGQSEDQVKAIEFYNEGVISFQDKDFADAVGFFTRAIKLDANFKKPLYQRALSKMYLKDYQPAAIDFKQCLEVEEYRTKSQYYLAYCQYQIEDYERAELNFNNAKKLDPDNDKIYYYLGAIQFKEKDYEGAMADFQTAISKGYASEKVWYYKGMSHYKTNDYDNAIKSFNKQLEINPDSYKTCLTLANLYQKKENFEEVVSFANQYLEHDEVNLDVLAMKATAFLKLESLGLAQKTYDQILDLDPSHGTALKNNLYISQKQEDKDRMIIDLSRLVKSEGPSSKYLYMRASTLMGMERFEDAMKDLNLVIETEADNAKAYYNRAILHGKAGSNDKACLDIRKSAELGYDKAFQYVRSYCDS